MSTPLSTSCRVVVIQKYLAAYRVPLFAAIARSPGVKLVVLCFGSPERRREGRLESRQEFQVEQAKGWSIPLSYERNLDFPVGLDSALARLAPDVIVCAPDWGGIAALRYSRRRRAQLIIWSEATDTTEQGVSAIKRAFRRYVYQRAAGFVVPGGLARDYIQSLGVVGPFFEVRNSIDEVSFRTQPSQVKEKFSGNGRRVITFSGSLVDRKGVRILLEAFFSARARHPDAAECAVLQIIGTGPLDISRLPVTGVEMLGYLQGESYREAMNRTHIFALPSQWDCNPLVVVEALNCGSALILSDGVGSYPEVLQGNGRLVGRGDLAGLTDALSWALTAPNDELCAMGLKSLAIAESFDSGRAAASFTDAILGCAIVQPT